MYRITHHQMPHNLSEMFAPNSTVHDHYTRQSSNLHIFPHRLNIRRFTVNIYGPKLWNSLSSYIKEAPNIIAFKKRYKNALYAHSPTVN